MSIKTIEQLVNVCRKANYFALDERGARGLQLKTILPFGQRLMENIRTEWQRSLGKDVHFLTEHQSRQEIIRRRPAIFSLAECETVDGGSQPSTEESTRFHIDATKLTRLTCTHFIGATGTKEFFYDIQRQRKIWWMKVNDARRTRNRFLTFFSLNFTDIFKSWTFFVVRNKDVTLQIDERIDFDGIFIWPH